MSPSRLIAALLCLTVVGCSNDLNSPTNPGSSRTTLTPDPKPAASTVILPAGSVDALSAAIAAAGRNGTVVLASGTHTESTPVLVTSPVSILGQPGAVLESGAAADPAAVVINGALHVRGTSNVSIDGLTIQGPGGATMGTAVLIESSSHVSVSNNVMSNVQYGLIIQAGDFARVSGNTVAVTSDWLTGVLADAQGIISMNGRGVIIENNTVSNGLFGIWCCDAKGQANGNSVSGCFVGIILCTVPANSFSISGVLYGADRSCTQWQVRDNDCSSNFTTGLLVIDNANRNLLVNNHGSGNGTYAIELTGDSYRFGFLTPASHANIVSMGQYADVQIKDCGNNNMILGATNVVDNTVDPCN